MTNKEHDTSQKKIRVWPGMPTPGMKFFELLLGFFPTWIGIIGISLALLLPLVQSCREWARDDAAESLPQNNAISDP